MVEAKVFADLVSFIEHALEEGNFCFRIPNLRHMYEHQLRDFNISKEINKSRFKDRLLNQFPQAQEQNDRKNTALVFQQGLQQRIQE